MATLQTEIESRALELATEALEAFCEDMSGMFGVEMQCEQQEIATQTIAGLKKLFKKLVAVNIVDSEGILDGTFQIILDQEGLFTLGGVMVMLPEKRILANRKDASADLAESMVDAVGEAGNLLVGAWERIFREELEGHGHLLQRLPAFVGKPWDKPQETIGLAGDEELVFIPYEMTIAPYPAFKCGVIFPKTIFASKSAADSEDAAPADDDAPQEAEPNAPDAKATPKKSESEEPEAAKKKAKRKKSAAKETPTAETPDNKADSEESGEEPEPEQPDASAGQTDDAPEASAADETTKEETATPESEEPAMGPVSEAIREMAQSPSVLPGKPGKSTSAKKATLDQESELLWICAKDIMQDQLVWASPEDSVQQALAKMQQHDAGYIVVGQDGALEGILSKSDAAGAISPYLRPMFAKWRRPSDDATLKIKIKWIMSRPVRTAKPETPLATIMENMCRFGGRALPVVDEQGKVQGLVTAFDIFQMLLNTGADVPTVGKAPQGPPLA